MIMHRETQSSIPRAEAKPIAVRAYVPPPAKVELPFENRPKRSQRYTSEWTLVFDTETTVDERQSLRFGAYQIYKSAKLDTIGLFYNPDVLSPDEAALLLAFAQSEGLECLTRNEFIESVFFRVGYAWRGTIVGFNLPFDVSRLAIRHGSARGATMRGGFTFELSPNRWQPKVQIKHINSKSALIQFTKPPRKPETRSEWKKKQKRPTKRGAFIDVKTHAAALLSGSFSLDSLGRFLEVENRKQTVESHGGVLTEDYIRYCLNDVQTTWECFSKLSGKLSTHGLRQTLPNKIFSEASLGKGYLKEMGIKPFSKVQPEFSPALTGQIISAYYGGRAEVHWRRDIQQVLYCDFLSMYPTVCTLMGLFRFVVAKGMRTSDSTAETRTLVQSVTLGYLQQQDFWKRLTTLVRVKPQADIFPVRAKYSGTSNTIGLNYLSSDEPLWFTLADVIASKLLTRKTPEILEAVSFSPSEAQEGLKPFSIMGKDDYLINPARDDLFKRVIDLRTTIKRQIKAAKGQRKDELNTQQLALKILANSTSYGIFVEVNVSDLDKAEMRDCFGPNGKAFQVQTQKSEEPGRHFHPLLATLITGAARLMLAITERLTLDSGIDWAFCDTDSMALAKPNEMNQETFSEKAGTICRWFEPLNPYEEKGSLFKIEDQNYALANNGANELYALYCLAISAKRYVLFNLAKDGTPIIRKASAHGLGHLLAPYGEDDAPPSIPAPSIPLVEIGVARWHYDLWFQIIRAVQNGHPDRVDPSYHPALDRPAASRYSATSPDLLRWFKLFNVPRNYRDQVKPFNFLVAFQCRASLLECDEIVFGAPKRGRKPKQHTPKPIAPFNKDVEVASRNAFDRDTGASVSSAQLRTYREAVSKYHLSPEAKFLQGDYVDHGRTMRRHIRTSTIECIGKEANKWEESFHVGSDEPTEITYGCEPGQVDLDAKIKELCAEIGQRKAAERLGISRTALIKALRHGSAALGHTLQKRLVRSLR